MSSVVVARDLSFELSNGRELFQQLNLSIDARLTALVGPNGIGKSCLASLLAGEMIPTSGNVRRGGSIKMVHQRELPPRISAAEYLCDHEWSLLGERLLRPIDLSASCTQLSGGQWMRLRLARALSADFLILDEPTNDLDCAGRELILHLLRVHERGILLISHDRECLSVCDHILELSNRGLMKFVGGWGAYQQSKADEQVRLSSALERAKRERDRQNDHRARQLERQQKRARRGARSGVRGGMPKILLGARKRCAETTTGRIDAAQSKSCTRQCVSHTTH